MHAPSRNVDPELKKIQRLKTQERAALDAEAHWAFEVKGSRIVRP